MNTERRPEVKEKGKRGMERRTDRKSRDKAEGKRTRRKRTKRRMNCTLPGLSSLTMKEGKRELHDNTPRNITKIMIETECKKINTHEIYTRIR